MAALSRRAFSPRAPQAWRRLAMEGADPLTIKALGGWKSLAMVARYADLSPSMAAPPSRSW
jgi:hypothetical protein